MVFETLYESALRGELILVDGGICHYHLRKDGQLTIREIISTRRGAGTQMLQRLMQVPGTQSIFARCPSDLESNAWYRHKGFLLEGTETTRTGRTLNLWRMEMNHNKPQTEPTLAYFWEEQS